MSDLSSFSEKIFSLNIVAKLKSRKIYYEEEEIPILFLIQSLETVDYKFTNYVKFVKFQ